MVDPGFEPKSLDSQSSVFPAQPQRKALICVWTLFPTAFLKLIFFYWLDSGKPAVDPAAAKLWTLSANDMEDESVVSQLCGHLIAFF